LSQVPWSDPLVYSSAILLAWVFLATAFNALYKPARHGRKVAYLTVASFVFLAMVLAVLVLSDSQHGGNRSGAIHSTINNATLATVFSRHVGGQP
jgi:hypothetical protein